MIDINTLFYNNRKLSIYTGRNIHGLYCYLEIIGYPPNLTNSGLRSYPFGTSSSTNNDTGTIQPVIADL